MVRPHLNNIRSGEQHRYSYHVCLAVCGVLLLGVPAFAAPPSETSRPPAFSDYPAEMPTECAERAGEGQRLREEIIDDRYPQGTAQRNFAGCWSLAIVGCGTQCNAVAAMYPGGGPIVWGPSGIVFDYRADSRLLIVNPLHRIRGISHELANRGIYSTFYVLDPERLTFIEMHRSRVLAPPQ